MEKTVRHLEKLTPKRGDVVEQKSKKVKKWAGKVIHSAVTQHAMEKADEIRKRYGSSIDYSTVLQILNDRRSIRYPVKVQFVSDGIEVGLFAKTEPVSNNPDEGYIISLHKHFEDQPDILPALILYQTVLVNYGDLATAIDAEFFGSGILGIDRNSYYKQIVELTDKLWND